MPISLALRSALNGRVLRDGIGASVALIVVIKADGHPRLAGWHDDIWDANRLSIVEARAKIRMQMPAPANAGDVVGRIGLHRQRGNIGVPDVI
jgi:hypothetical protein